MCSHIIAALHVAKIIDIYILRSLDWLRRERLVDSLRERALKRSTEHEEHQYERVETIAMVLSADHS